MSEFLSENFQFLEVKFSIYLNRRVFLMGLSCVSSLIFLTLKVTLITVKKKKKDFNMSSAAVVVAEFKRNKIPNETKDLLFAQGFLSVCICTKATFVHAVSAFTAKSHNPSWSPVTEPFPKIYEYLSKNHQLFIVLRTMSAYKSQLFDPVISYPHFTLNQPLLGPIITDESETLAMFNKVR